MISLVICSLYLLVLPISLAVIGDWSESKNLDGWLTPLDKCILKSRGEDVLSDCRKTTGIQEAQQPLRCSVGNSWPSKSGFCSSVDLSFDDRKNFIKSLYGYDDPSAKPMYDFFKALAAEKGAVLFIGDSVMQQFVNAVACELEREGVWQDRTRFTNTDETYFVQADPSVTHQVPIKFLPIYHFVNSKFDRVANASMAALRKNVEAFVDKYESVYIMLNMGLHYVVSPVAQFSRIDYRSQMTAALHYLHNIALRSPSGKIRIYWRETSAQHFPTYNGYWPGVRYAQGLRLACVPINDTSPEADWRNGEISDIVKTHSYFGIRVIPFYNETVPLWDMHVNGHKQDCTHFCWTPMLYQYLFHYMRNSIVSSTHS